MKFRIDELESTFRIVFKREHKEVTFISSTGKQVSTKSKHPATTVTIYRDKDRCVPGEVYRTATVGCSHHDTYSPEQGRLAALRLVSKTFDKDFKTILWGTYMGYKKAQRAEAKAKK